MVARAVLDGVVAGGMRWAAEAALGEAFDLRAFHDVVLGGGALPLPILAEQVDAWINGQR